MNIQMFARVFGIVFIIVGILGFFTGLVAPPSPTDPPMSVQYGYLFGLFPVNFLHNVTHLGLGLWGILACKTVAGSLTYARSIAVIYAVLGVMGMIPVLNTTFGLIPLFGNDVWLHLLTAVVAAYFGFMAPVMAERHLGHKDYPGHA